MNKKRKYGLVTLVCIVLLTSICLYEVHISYNNVSLNNYAINNEKINEDINMVIISDLHDKEFGEDNEELINKIKEQSPEVILVVGDMINKDSKDINVVINLMKKLANEARVFYSLGNSEEDYIAAGTSHLIKQLEYVGVTVLDKEYEDIKINNTIIRIGGMYDYAFGLNDNNTVDKDTMGEGAYDFLCEFQDTDDFKIMMAHRPDSFIFGNASKVWDVDLVVSGHTHGGQVVVPFLGGLYVGDQGWFPQYTKGLYDLDKMKMIITSGLGSNTQKLPRFNNVPEVVDLKITP